MSADEFRESVEGREAPVNSHGSLLRIAFVYLDEALWDGKGVSNVVEQLHTRGWSFGQGEFRFNR